jgi:hypothetical protein
MKKRFLSAWSSGPPLAISDAVVLAFHIGDDGLPTLVDVDVLDADVLMPAMTKPPKYLNLGCISPHQTSGSRPERRNPPFRCEGDVQLADPGAPSKKTGPAPEGFGVLQAAGTDAVLSAFIFFAPAGTERRAPCRASSSESLTGAFEHGCRHAGRQRD